MLETYATLEVGGQDRGTWQGLGGMGEVLAFLEKFGRNGERKLAEGGGGGRLTQFHLKSVGQHGFLS